MMRDLPGRLDHHVLGDVVVLGRHDAAIGLGGAHDLRLGDRAIDRRRLDQIVAGRALAGGRAAGGAEAAAGLGSAGPEQQRRRNGGRRESRNGESLVRHVRQPVPDLAASGAAS